MRGSVPKPPSDPSSFRCWPNIPLQTAHCLPSCAPLQTFLRVPRLQTSPHTPVALGPNHQLVPQWKVLLHSQAHRTGYLLVSQRLSHTAVFLMPHYWSVVQRWNSPLVFSSAIMKHTNCKMKCVAWRKDHRNSLKVHLTNVTSLLSSSGRRLCVIYIFYLNSLSIKFVLVSIQWSIPLPKTIIYSLNTRVPEHPHILILIIQPQFTGSFLDSQLNKPHLTAQ